MTYNEAILRIMDHIAVHKIGQFPHYHIAEALKMAIEALEKQIKKKPLNVTYDDGYLEYWNCPNCHIQHSEEIKVFCDVCGQAIDWRSVRDDG